MKEGWQMQKLGAVCKIIAGQSPKSTYYNDIGVGLPFYQGKKEFQEKYIGDPRQWTSIITKEALRNDILMSVRAPVGPINFATQKCCIGRGLAAIRCSGQIHKDYGFYFLQSIQDKLIGNNGAVFNSINKTQISNIQIPIPPLAEQKQIVAILDKAFAAIDQAKANIETNIANAKELFQSRLNEIFSQRGEEITIERLDKICQVKDGTHDSPKYVDEKDGIPFITQKNILESGISFEKTKFISLVDHEHFYKRSNVALNDILIAMIGANRGMACIVDNNREWRINKTE